MSMKTNLTAAALALFLAACAHNPSGNISLAAQGSFAVGGTVKTSTGTYTPVPSVVTGKDSNPFWDVYNASVAAGGQTLHGDHASVFYQIPAKAKAHPLVFLHGHGQSARSWQTTADGREGFDTLFLRQGYPVYLIDQPRRGQAGQSTVASEIPALPDDQFWYAQFRIGVYPNMNKGVQFPRDAASQEQFFRQMTPSTGAFDVGVITSSMVKLFEKTGDGIFVTHSAGGLIGWTTAMQSKHVKAIVAYEPGNFPFPEGQVPAVQKSRFGDVAPMRVSEAEFAKLTRLPIVIYFGDFIPTQLDGTQGGEQWYIRLQLAKQWAEAVNQHGGDVTVIELPKVGITGNTHFPFSDLNNVEVAKHLQGWLKEKGLDK